MQKLILVVEDEPDIAWVLRVMLVAAGFAVVLTADLASARAALLAGPAPDLAILDDVLPDGSGFDLCRELKAVRPAMPVIAISARTDADREAQSCGADAYMSKPFDIDLLEVEVRRRLP
jgi:DNA-binding response OmpR family regulator